MLRGLAGVVCFMLGLALSGAALLYADWRFGGIWLPLTIPVLLYFALSLLPRARPSRLPYAFFTGAGVLEAWFATRDVAPTERLARAFLYAPFACLAVGVIGIIWWLIAASTGVKRPAVGWLLALSICAWAVAYFSSAKGAAAPMEDFLARVFALGPESAHTFTVLFRKSIHFGFYGCVGLIGLVSARRSGSPYPILFALIVAIGYAAFDEYRQGLIPGRTSSLYDVLLDTAGAGAFIFLGSLRGDHRTSAGKRAG